MIHASARIARVWSGLTTIALYALLAGVAHSQTSPGDAARSPEQAKAVCDMACVAAHAERAVQLCVPRIEAEAPSDYEWLYRPIGGVFKQADAPELASSTIARYRGDNFRVLNGDQAWIRAAYECGFDVVADKVAYVRLQPGIIGKPAAAVLSSSPSPARAAPLTASTSANPPPRSASSASQSPSTTIDLNRVGEPSEVSVRQIGAGQRSR